MSIASQITRLTNAKASIKAAIERKGVTVPSTAKLDEFGTYVNQIISEDYFWVEPMVSGTAYTFKFAKTGAYVTENLVLEYSYDKNTWTTFNVGTDISVTNGAKVYLRSNKPTQTYYDSTYLSLVVSVRCKIGGRIVSLNGNVANETCSNLGYLFKGSNVVDASQLVLPTILTYSCFAYMFSDCTTLVTPPVLTATVLDTYCYDHMFSGCTSLTSAPALPATTLNTYCYQYMFSGCTSLTTPPTLPATTLANYCYRYMFSGCTSLRSLPSLPATTLTNYCYNYMFSGCTSIKLSSTQPASYVSAYRIPTSGTGTTASQALNNMFYSTGGTFTGTPTINTTYYTSNTIIS